MANQKKNPPVPKFDSNFLKQYASYTARVHEISVYPKGRGYRECAEVFCGNVSTYGVPSYNGEYWAWPLTPEDLFNQRCGGPRLLLFADCHARVCQESGDEEIYLNLKLKHAFEASELFELMKQLNPENCKSTTFQEVPWSSVVQDVFVLVPSENKLRLAKFSWAGWISKVPKLLRPFFFFYKETPTPKYRMDLHFSSWLEWLEASSELPLLEYAGELAEDDLLFSREPHRVCGGFESAQNFMEGYKPEDDRGAPRLVIRLKPQHSRLYFIDFLEHTQEGQLLYQTLKYDLERLPQVLSQTRIKYPGNRLMQIRLGVEWRAARYAYEKKVELLMTTREPAEQLQKCYRLRAKAVELLHTEFLSDMEAVQHPLPFMIEWPHRRYQRADDRLLKIKYGQQLLSIMVKLPLFLALEELRTRPELQAAIATIEAELFGKPNSDGSILRHGRDLQNVVARQNLSSFWFDPLLKSFKAEGESRIGRIIEARNRFHHPPHDDRAYLEALESEIPPLMAMFRQALSGLLFITPENQNFENGRHVVNFRHLMGYEADFPTQQEFTTIPFEGFPNGEVVIVDSGWQRTLPLTRFFKRQTIQTVSLDVGVFDRMVHGHPEYVFIRGIGQDVA